MAQITASLVKGLRDKTGIGMMDCKKALTETDGDIEAAIDWLRKKGLSMAAKKSGRAASEGLVGFALDDGARAGAIVEVNAETDFVARNVTFQDFVGKVAGLALECGGDMEALKGASFPGTERTVEEQLTHLIATIGENMNLRRAAVLEVDGGTVAAYMHNALAPGLGKIGVLVALQSTAAADKLATLGKQLAMHVAASNPLAVGREDLEPAALERERGVLSEQARASGKPESIIEKMVEGRLRKFYEETCLVDQTFVIDGESKVAKVLEAAAKEAGGAISVKGFRRFALGEGIEKRDQDFAGEVAAMTA